MEISNPKRILAVSLEGSTVHLANVIKGLTGNPLEQTSSSLAGTTHNLRLSTVYYTAEVPIWLDLISSPEEWAESFLSPEAKEVLEVLGGVVIVFSLPTTPDAPDAAGARELIRNVGKVVREGLGGWDWDGVGLCLGVGEIDDVDEWEDCAAESGLEFVQVRSRAVPERNEFGEKTGIPRALEALEANNWTGATSGDLDSDGDDFGDFQDEAGPPRLKSSLAEQDGKDEDDAEFDPESLEFGFDREDFAGLRRAIWEAGQDDAEDDASKDPGKTGQGKEADEKIDDEEVAKIERMMLKLSAVRDMSAGLPEDQRKRMAAKAVSEVMKEL